MPSAVQELLLATPDPARVRAALRRPCWPMTTRESGPGPTVRAAGPVGYAVPAAVAEAAARRSAAPRTSGCSRPGQGGGSSGSRRPPPPAGGDDGCLRRDRTRLRPCAVGRAQLSPATSRRGSRLGSRMRADCGHRPLSGGDRPARRSQRSAARRSGVEVRPPSARRRRRRSVAEPIRPADQARSSADDWSRGERRCEAAAAARAGGADPAPPVGAAQATQYRPSGQPAISSRRRTTRLGFCTITSRPDCTRTSGPASHQQLAAADVHERRPRPGRAPPGRQPTPSQPQSGGRRAARAGSVQLARHLRRRPAASGIDELRRPAQRERRAPAAAARAPPDREPGSDDATPRRAKGSRRPTHWARRSTARV